MTLVLIVLSLLLCALAAAAAAVRRRGLSRLDGAAAFACVALSCCAHVREASVDLAAGAPRRAPCDDGAWRCFPAPGEGGEPQFCRRDPESGVSRWLPTTANAPDAGPAPCRYCVVTDAGASCGVSP